MRISILPLSVLLILIMTAGCRTSAPKSEILENFPLALTDSGLALQTMKALDAGETDKVYRTTLIHLKDSMVRMRFYLRHGRVSQDDRRIARPVLQVVLKYVEQEKERLGAEAWSDYCALEIVKVLCDTLSMPEDVARARALREYFDSRFVKEREFYE